MHSNTTLKRVGLRLACAILLLSLPSLPAVAVTRRDKAGAPQSVERFAKFEGMRVHYRSYGKGREALVFVHCWTCDLNFWRMQFPAFDGKRMRVIALDLPGHGQSDKPQTAYTMDLFARSVEAVMRDAGVRRAVLVGHSMGTPVVRQFYRKYPEKTLALGVVDGALYPFATRAAMEQFIAPLRGADYKEVAGKMIEGMTAQQTPALRAEVKASMLSTPQHVAVSAMEGMAEDSVWAEDQIKVPVLAILARTPFWPADIEQRYRKLAPALDYRMWDGVSHFLMMDRPAEFNRELSDFISRRKLLKQK
ncbi:MAG: alpha/beta hydrolase [Acidobacteria bacterium]|nr:alpha/beta hydrolase [Acidobacteriota bacterium]